MNIHFNFPYFIKTKPLLFRYGIVLLAVAVAALITRNIPVLAHRATFIFFLIVITQVVYWFGRSYGVLALALSLLAVNLLILAPMWILEPYNMAALNIGFIGVSVIMINIVNYHRKLVNKLWISRKTLNHAQSVSKTGCWRLDIHNNQVNWSEETSRIFGTERGVPITYDIFLSIVHPEDREYVNQKWQAALTGEDYDIVHRIIVNGQIKWIREKAELEFHPSGELLGGFGTAQDITELRQSESMLQETQQQYAEVIHSAMDAIITIDAAQRIMVFNTAAENMFGCKAGEVMGESIERFIPGSFKAVHGEYIHNFEHTSRDFRKTVDRIITGLRCNGEEFPIEASISKTVINGEKVYTAILRDITYRIYAESILNEQLRLQDQLTKIAASVPGVICAFRLRPDGSTCMPYASQAFKSIYGLNHEEVAHDFSPVFARVHNMDFEHIHASVTESAHTLKPWRAIFRYDHPTKGERWIEGHSMPQREKEGGVLWHGYIQDITERKHAEIALFERENELRLIMDAAPALIAYFDYDIRYLKVNKTYEYWYCMNAENIIGRTAQEIMGRETWTILQPYFEMAKRGEQVSFDHQILYGGGNPRWVHGNYIPYKEANGQIKGVVAYISDIDNRKQAELERQKFVSLANNSQEFIGICDMNFTPLYVNAAGLRLVGLDDLERALRTPVQEFFFPEDQRFIIDVFLPRVLREKNGEIEIRFRHFQTGDAIYMIYNVFFIESYKGEAIGLATVSRNITERKRADAALRESEGQRLLAFQKHLYETRRHQSELEIQNKRLEQSAAALETSRRHYLELYDFAPVGYLSLNAEGIIIEVNFVGAQQLGIDKNQLINQQFIQFFADQYKSKWQQYFLQTKQQKSKQSIELPIRRRDGTCRYVRFDCEPRKTEGIFLLLRISLTDVTERTLAEIALRESEARLALVIEVVKVGYEDWDLITKKIFYSPVWKAQLGYEAHELSNQWIEKQNRLHPDDRAIVEGTTESCIAGHLPGFELEFRLRHKNGSYRWIHARNVVLRNENNQPYRLLGLNLDITEYKQRHELITRRNKMEQSFQLYIASQTAAAIAHELNQPLTAISYYADVAQQLLKTDNSNPLKLSDIMDKCSQQALRAGGVIRQLMTILHKGESITEPIDINASIHEAVNCVKLDEQVDFFNMQLDLASDLPLVMANSLQIQKVLINLLYNALDSMREGGSENKTIHISTQQISNPPFMVKISVCDSGKGVVDKTALKSIFQPFNTTKPNGLGMGLAISRALIETLGGKIWAEQNVAFGITIHFTLPFAI